MVGADCALEVSSIHEYCLTAKLAISIARKLNALIFLVPEGE